MKAYKAVTSDNKACLGKGYSFEPGKTYEEEYSKCIESGFHCASDPFDCLNYYKWDDKNQFYIIEALGDIDETDGDSKIACTKIKFPKKPLTMAQYVLEEVRYIISNPKKKYCNIHGGKVRRTVDEHTQFNIEHGAIVAVGENPKVSAGIGTLVFFVIISDNEVRNISSVVIDGKDYKTNTYLSYEDTPFVNLKEVELCD